MYISLKNNCTHTPAAQGKAQIPEYFSLSFPVCSAPPHEATLLLLISSKSQHVVNHKVHTAQMLLIHRSSLQIFQHEIPSCAWGQNLNSRYFPLQNYFNITSNLWQKKKKKKQWHFLLTRPFSPGEDIVWWALQKGNQGMLFL